MATQLNQTKMSISSKVLFLVCVSIVLLCVQPASSDDEHDKAAADAWLRDKLNRGYKSCATINAYPKKGNKASTFAAWTVVILAEDFIGIMNTSALHTQQCTGSLIALDVVLTSASCMDGTDPSKLIVRAGEVRQGTRHQEKRIRSVIKHEQFSMANGSHDIALVFLMAPFHKTSLVNTVCLGSSKIENELANVNCTITGWRPTRTLNTIPGYSRFTTTMAKVISRDSCQEVLQQTGLGENVTDSNILCAVTNSNLYTLMKSSGAPLVCKVCTNRVIQVGVLSYGFETSSLPFVLTAVHQHRNWIDKNFGSSTIPYNC